MRGTCLRKAVVGGIVAVAGMAQIAVAGVNVGVSTPDVNVQVGSSSPAPPPAVIVAPRERVLVGHVERHDRGRHRGHYKKDHRGHDRGHEKHRGHH